LVENLQFGLDQIHNQSTASVDRFHYHTGSIEFCTQLEPQKEVSTPTSLIPSSKKSKTGQDFIKRNIEVEVVE